MIQKSIPIFVNVKPPHSAAAKKLLREILSGSIQPLQKEEIARIRKHYKTRKRVFLSKRDQDLIHFFDTASKGILYAVFLEFNKKLQEVKP